MRDFPNSSTKLQTDLKSPGIVTLNWNSLNPATYFNYILRKGKKTAPLPVFCENFRQVVVSGVILPFFKSIEQTQKPVSYKILACPFPYKTSLHERTEVNISSYPVTRVTGLFFHSRAVIFKSGCFVQKYWSGTVTRKTVIQRADDYYKTHYLDSTQMVS